MKTEMTRKMKVMLWVLGTAEELREAGLVEMNEKLTDQGREKLEKLRAEGFSPTEEERRNATRALMAGCGLRMNPKAMKGGGE